MGGGPLTPVTLHPSGAPSTAGGVLHLRVDAGAGGFEGVLSCPGAVEGSRAGALCSR